jgi:adenine/guanine phosphoribosyltransferase-like PRPP-binding protein
VVPASLYQVGFQLHHFLKYYKDASHRSRDEYAAKIISLLAYFLVTHGPCIAAASGTEWDLVTTVPSSKDRAGFHPLAASLDRVTSLRRQHEELLTKGSVAIDHLTASDKGYKATRRLDGESVLLVDDTFTSGARSQSAASALALAGAEVVAIVPIGRVIDPNFNDTAKAYWQRQKGIVFSFGECVLEQQGESEDDDFW